MAQQTEEYGLFDKTILDNLDFSKFKSNFNPPISITEPGSGLLVRPLQSSDYNAGFIETLGQLTKTGDVSHSEFMDAFQTMRKCPNMYFITVIEDVTLGRVVGSATLILEQKFIHKCALRGRVEDVVVNNDYRGKQLGKLLVATMVLLAEQLGVYKLTLDCRDQMVSFYQSFGYSQEPGNSNYMLVATMVLLAEQLGVYKLTLDCRDQMVSFYQSFGYSQEPGNSNYMQIRFRD